MCEPTHRARRNSKAQARANIAAHYDLGNEFYRLFLDETMTYSAAVFEHPGQPLADAQRNKYRRIADGAGLTAGMHVLEIGSGWGGFALYAAGELVGGLFYHNYPGGSGLMAGAVFGRIAGRSAATASQA